MTSPTLPNGEIYKPPFVYFGGKSAVADIVWAGLGDVKNYVEPFFGTGAVLFLRPGGAGQIETVNDADGFVANFWRALRADPNAVADAADWPVNEADLHARHLWLVGQRERITDRLCGDPDFFDAKAAGWWAWGLNCWIGAGWCSGNGPWGVGDDGAIAMRNSGRGVNRQLPHLGNSGQGVNRQLPHLRNSGQGVNRKLPHLRNSGQGVNRKLPHLGNGRGTIRNSIPAIQRREWLCSYLGGFAERLARVRVCCGDWSRVCGPSVTFKHGVTGVFLDPPYADTAGRDGDLYAVDCQQVAHAARAWAVEQGENPLMRIVLCGYEGEHDMPRNWRIVEWKTTRGGYGSQNMDENGTGRKNRHRERLWFSPHCIKPDPTNASLFVAEPQ